MPQIKVRPTIGEILTMPFGYYTTPSGRQLPIMVIERIALNMAERKRWEGQSDEASRDSQADA